MVFQRAWTSEEEIFLRENISRMPIKELAQALNRSMSAVRSRTLKYALRAPAHKVKRWTKKELHTLYVLSERLTIPLIAEKMGRSVPSVKSKMIELGVRPLSDCMSVKQMARETGYACPQIYRAVRALGLNMPKVRSRTHGQYVVGYDMYEQIVEYLKTEPHKVYPPAEVRFFSMVEKTPTCWLWKGGKQYFDVHTKREYKPARMAWFLLKGPLKYEERLYSSCKNRKCCNPEHHWVGVVNGSSMTLTQRRMALARGRNGPDVEDHRV